MKNEIEILTQRGLIVPSEAEKAVILAGMSHHADDTREGMETNRLEYARGSQDDLWKILRDNRLTTVSHLLAFARPCFKTFDSAFVFSQYIFDTAEMKIRRMTRRNS